MIRFCAAFVCVLSFVLVGVSDDFVRSKGKYTYLKDVNGADLPKITECYEKLSRLARHEGAVFLLLDDVMHLQTVLKELKGVQDKDEMGIKLGALKLQLVSDWDAHRKLSQKLDSAIEADQRLTAEKKKEQLSLLKARYEKNFVEVRAAIEKTAKDGWVFGKPNEAPKLPIIIEEQKK